MGTGPVKSRKIVWRVAAGIVLVLVAFAVPRWLLQHTLPGGYRVTSRIDKSKTIVDGDGHDIMATPEWSIDAIASGRRCFVARQVRSGPATTARWILVDTVNGGAIEFATEAGVRTAWMEQESRQLRFADLSWY